MSDDAFFYWLSGFIDGEGCFNIRPRRKPSGNVGYDCRMTLAVRADDVRILREIHERTGIGYLTEPRLQSPKHNPKSKPLVRWEVADKAGCLALVELLDRYPLRAKKAIDFGYWRQAVILWQDCRPRQRFDWAAIAYLKMCMEAARTYQEAVVA